jgi:hypothetical protein
LVRSAALEPYNSASYFGAVLGKEATMIVVRARFGGFVAPESRFNPRSRGLVHGGVACIWRKRQNARVEKETTPWRSCH